MQFVLSSEMKCPRSVFWLIIGWGELARAI